jgi:hypothetical protein
MVLFLLMLALCFVLMPFLIDIVESSFALILFFRKVVLVVFFCRVSNNSMAGFTLLSTLVWIRWGCTIQLGLSFREFGRSLAKRDTSLFSDFLDILNIVMTI